MTACKPRFIIVDDNKLDCYIAEKIIRNTGISECIRLFNDANEALAFIKGDHPPVNKKKDIIIVDIQMPLMNGFEFVEAFEKLSEEICNSYIIYVLSSSINQNDLNRVSNYRSVKQLLNKPLTGKKLSLLVEEV